MSSFFLVRGTDPAGADRIEITGAMVVGRSDDCDLTVRDGHPSRRHARLTLEDGHLWLEDLGSANGTFVNDRQITARTELRSGDRIAFDLATFVVAADIGADPEATVVRRPPEDQNATVVRSTVGAACGRDSAAEESRPQAAPTGGAVSGGDSSAPSNVPRSWADPEYQAAGTRVLSREELAAMAAGAGATPVGEAAVSGPHLRVLVGTSAGAVLHLGGQQTGEWTIGSDAERDLVLQDEGISGFHAKISHDAGRWRIIDQMSANGTWVNGEKVTVSYLGNGDRVRFAQVECEVQIGGSRRAAGGGRSAPARRTWLIAAAAAAITVAVLAAVSWLA